MEETIDYQDWIPVFPLPNAVLLPRSILPLHVFESRYCAMTADALDTSRLIAVALLQPGFESSYHTLHAPLHHIVGVGRIFREEMLDGGRYNFLLQGITRGQILEENLEKPYRRAHLAPISPMEITPEAEASWRIKLSRILHTKSLLQLATSANWLDIIECPSLNLSELVDVLADVLIQNPQDKQVFLEDPDVETRADRLCGVLKTLAENAEQATSESKGHRTGQMFSEN